MKLRISNIDRITSEEDIEQLCDEFGEVNSVELNEEPDPGVETFSAIVEMEFEEDAKEIMADLNGEMVDGRFLRVEAYTEGVDEANTNPNSLDNRFDFEEEWDDNSTWEPIERKRPRETKEVSKPPKRRKR